MYVQNKVAEYESRSERRNHSAQNFANNVKVVFLFGYFTLDSIHNDKPYFLNLTEIYDTDRH